MQKDLLSTYFEQGKFTEAVKLLVGTLETAKQELGTEHPEVAKLLNNLAFLHRFQAKYEESERYYREALAIDQNLYGDDQPQVAAVRD